MKNEADVKKRVKKLLDQYGWFWWMTPANGYGKSGVTDFCAFKDGVLVVIETKFGKNKATTLQRAFMGSIASQHGFAFVVNEDNLDWLDRWLAGFDRSAKSIAENKTMSNTDGAELLDAIAALTEMLK